MSGLDRKTLDAVCLALEDIAIDCHDAGNVEAAAGVGEAAAIIRCGPINGYMERAWERVSGGAE